jgi:hypothetical protein
MLIELAVPPMISTSTTGALMHPGASERGYLSRDGIVSI